MVINFGEFNAGDILPNDDAGVKPSNITSDADEDLVDELDVTDICVVDSSPWMWQNCKRPRLSDT